MDFATVMVVALLVMGAIWWADAALWRPRREGQITRLQQGQPGPTERQRIEKLSKEPVLVEYARSFFPVILIVLLLRSFLVEPFRIPSGSMMPTLLIGDFILVNKFAYGIRLPVVDAKIIEIGAPERGDVVVFRYPEDPSVDYIKRVVAVPGDLIGYYNKTIYLNGEPVEQSPLGRYEGVGAGVSMSGAALLIERLDEVEHQILVDPSKQLSREGEVRIPEGYYFVMGDNRDNSNDSRYWGLVPDDNLVGKAFMIWMNWDSLNGGVSWQRIGTHIR